MRVLVCGGRDFNDMDVVYYRLSELHSSNPITEIVHGGARGADWLASNWAIHYGVATHRFPADWIKYGRSAGPIRNAEMLKTNPDLVVAFPGGKGTADMVRQATKVGVKVMIVPPVEAK